MKVLKLILKNIVEVLSGILKGCLIIGFVIAVMFC